jgi:hypothetical protein
MPPSDIIRFLVGFTGAWLVFMMIRAIILYYQMTQHGHLGVRPMTMLLDRLSGILLVTYIVIDISSRLYSPLTWRTPLAAFSIGIGIVGTTSMVADFHERHRKLKTH